MSGTFLCQKMQRSTQQLHLERCLTQWYITEKAIVLAH